MKRKGLVIATLAALAASGGAGATNGYMPSGFGTTNKGMAGAGAALPQDGMTVATNPAGGVMLGERIDVGVSFFSPKRGVDVDGGGPFAISGSYDSDKDIFLIPSFAWNKPIDDKSAVTVAVGGNGGLNTEYDAALFNNFGGSSSPTGVDLAQLFVGVSYSRKLNEKNSIGVMPVFAVQRFKAEGLEPFANPFFSSDSQNVTNNGYDYSYGAGLRVGWLGQPTDRVSLAASYQTKLYMSEFDEYSGLFADDGDFDTPAVANLGIAFKVTDDVTVVADYQRIWYSQIRAIGNDFSSLTPVAMGMPPSAQLGDKNGAGFGWDDINIIKLGVQWEATPQWTLRAGYSHSTETFGDSEVLFNVLAPATPTDHASVGFTYTTGANEISLAYTHAFEEEVSGTNPFNPGQTITDRMYQNELEVSWAYKF